MGEQSWNNRAALPASNTLTFTRRAEAAISNSDTKLGVLHPLCELPSAYFPIELAADGDAVAKKKKKNGLLSWALLGAPWVNFFRVTTQQPHNVCCRALGAETP